MGGSAGGGNAQLFELMSQYGDKGGGKQKLTPGQAVRQAAQNQATAVGRNPGSFGSAMPMLLAYMRSKGRLGGGGGGGDGGNPTAPPAQPPTEAQKFAWQFPEYTQSWAFTPPTPTPYEYPQPFDPKKYGDPFNKKNIKKNT